MSLTDIFTQKVEISFRFDSYQTYLKLSKDKIKIKG